MNQSILNIQYLWAHGLNNPALRACFARIGSLLRCRLILGVLILLLSPQAFAAYTFPGALPTGCISTGGGNYTCGALNINDNVVFNDAGTVTITVNGALTVGSFNVGSAAQTANVTFVSNGAVTISAPTMYANVSSGVNAISVSVGNTPYIAGTLTTSTGNISIRGTVTKAVTSTTGTISLQSAAIVNGAVSSSSGNIYLYGSNRLASTATCASCYMVLYAATGNILTGNVAVANFNDLSVGASYGGSITATGTASVDPQIVLGTGAQLTGNAISTSAFQNNAYVFVGDTATVGGYVSATATSATLIADAYVYVGIGAHVTGNVSASTAGTLKTANIESRLNAVVNGTLTATAPTANLASVVVYPGTVGGSVISSGSVANSGNVAGCVQSTNNSALTPITLNVGSTSGGVCCGSSGSCGSSCVVNLTLGTMPALCGASVLPNNFNCTAVGASSNNGHLYTQVAASAFSVDVMALKNTGAVETSFVGGGQSSKNVTLEFVDGSGSTACASRTALNPTVSQTVTFTSADGGRKTVTATINKAYRDLRCRVTDANQSPSVLGCSTDDFAVRPDNFSLTATSSADADATGTSTTATPKVKAGANFALTATANAVGYDGTPLVDNTKLQAHASASHNGSISGGFGTANATTSIATGSSFSYSEAGYFRLAANGIYDSSFTSVDAVNGDCTTGFSASGGINACSFGNSAVTSYFGRFYPDHFAASPVSITPSCGSSFSYFGQDGVTTGFTLTAQNAANVTTQNYAGSFAKLGLTTWSNYVFTAATLPTGATLSASALAPTGTWSAGSALISAKHQISRPTAASAPVGIIFYAAPLDSDGVTMASTAVSASTNFRYGRLTIANAYGSELLPLTVPVEAQYWSGSAYQRNQLDSCSVVSTGNIAMGNYKNNLAACETALSGGGTLSSGKINFQLSAPGSGNNGSVDLGINLNSASGSTCNPTANSASSAAMPWFGSSNPSARETFGFFKSPVIYMRENY